MLTIFSTLKPRNVAFADNVQRNAIQSWMALDPCEILLLGSDEGTAEIAAEYGLHHEPNIPRVSHTLPLAKNIFARSQELASYDLMMYINSDIILLSDFIPTLERIIEERKNSDKNFLIVGQRHDLDLSRPLDFQNPHWEPLLREDTKRRGFIHDVWGIDYFIFRKGNWPGEIPTFAIGAIYFDNWLLYHARSSGIDIINATGGITAIQQEYEDRSSYAYQFKREFGPAPQHQKSLVQEDHMLFDISYSNLIYTPSGLRRRPVKLLLKKIFIEREGLALYPRYRALFYLTQAIYNLVARFQAEPISRTRLKRIIYETGEIRHPRLKVFFQALRFLHRIEGFRVLFWVLFTPPRFLNRMLIDLQRNIKK